MSKKFLDLVIAGPDMSGTGTQIKDLIEFFWTNGKVVKDLRGTEMDALFHAKEYENAHKGWAHLSEAPPYLQKDFTYKAQKLMSGGGTNQDLKVASMVETPITTYVDPNSADVWIMEEPTKRGAGQVCRAFEQNRSQFGDSMNPISAAFAHQAYRSEEFFRFRKPLRDNGKTIVRSRSEESACYQIYDEDFLQNGISMDEYINLPGHKIAFGNPPTDIFVVSGPEDWTTSDYLELKNQRSSGRFIDDHESNAEYQVMVNNRYASGWLETLYELGCKVHGGEVPKITRFNIYDKPEEIREKMEEKVLSLLEARASEGS